MPVNLSSHFNKSFYTSHPHIYNFMDKILELQSEIYIKINSINDKTPNQKKFETMQKIIQQYNENTITRAEYYIKMMSYYYADII